MSRRPLADVTWRTRPRTIRSIRSTRNSMSAFLFLCLASCTGESPLSVPVGAPEFGPTPAVVDADPVEDLTVAAVTASSVTLHWTEVDDGTGDPAEYRLKYAPSPIDWSSAAIGCERTIRGTVIGAERSCIVTGLETGVTYDFQLMSYRIVRGKWQGAVYSNVVTATPSDEVAATGDAGAVTDLAVVDRTSSSLTVGWTQVHDGAGAPAYYRVKYDGPPIDWSTATVGCDATLVGDQIGAPMSCTITGLTPGTTYDVQLMSYRIVDGAWQGAVYSNVANGATMDELTTPPSPPTSSTGPGIWISPEEIAALPMSGAAWDRLYSEANSSCGSVNLEDQDSRTNVCVMAKALVYARTGQSHYRSDVVTAIRQIVNAGSYNGLALAMGRELGAYVIAADLIGLPSHDPSLDQDFRTELRTLRTTYTSGAAASLIDCHEKRPNNWGAHCGATRMAIALYLGDTADFERAVDVFHGYVGNRAAYAGFSYGELSWQCDPGRPVGINPVGCARDGLSLDGVLPDDQRRGGTFTTSPPKENYVWEAMQGLLAQAHILTRRGYPAFEWEDRALLRAARWLHEVVDYPAEGDDTWQPHVLNHYYGTSFPAPVPSRPGKNVGWTDWTLR